jgi:hypothetical protein
MNTDSAAIRPGAPAMILTPEIAAQRAQLRQVRQQAQNEWRAALRGDELLALACVPFWTASLAERVKKLDIGALDLPKRHADGYLEEIRPPLKEDQTAELIRFEMPLKLRSEVFQEHTKDPQLRAVIWKKVQRIANALERVALPADPQDTRQWAQLVAPAKSTEQFVDRVDGLVREAESASQIHSIVRLAKGFAPLLQVLGEAGLEVTMLRAGRRIELLHRSEDDRVHLQHFQQRGNQLKAIGELILDNAHWALHLVGAGGVGKTTLLRFISSEYAKDRCAVARVDFDYLNPDYPRLAPGMLLWAFGQDLRAYGAGRFDQLLKEADSILDKLHQQLRANSKVGESLAEHPDFRMAASLYVEAMKTLQRPVLLILDTCEELARIRPDGTLPDNVRDTFAILEILNRDLRSLRVILAGRRPLARQGFGWRCTDAPAGLPEREFLRLHEIRGFERERSLQYLTDAGVSKDLHESIIRRCTEMDSVMKVEWQDPALKPTDESRCNPYELRLYAEWANETPAPDAHTIDTVSAEQYVEFRILRRLRHRELERLLPVIATLGHIDDDLLRHLSPMEEDSFLKLQRALRQREWTNVRVVVDPKASEPRHIYGVEPRVCERLRSYFVGRRDQWERLLETAWRYLWRKTLRSDLSGLDWTDFDATFNALCATGKPRYVTQWWQLAEHRLLERGPQWTRDLLKYLQGSQDPGGKVIAKATKLETDIARQVRPAILAAYATALAECDQYSSAAADIWAEVLDGAAHYPSRRMGARLRLRAATGRLSGSYDKLTADDLQMVRSVLAETRATDIDLPCLISMVRAAERLLDRAELATFTGTPPEPQSDRRIRDLILEFDDRVERYRAANATSNEVEALSIWMQCLCARAQARVGEAAAAQKAFQDARTRATPDLDSRRLWSATDSSSSLAVRVHLEYARVAYPAWGRSLDVLNQIETAVNWRNLPKLAADCPIDIDRLTSIALDISCGIPLWVPHDFDAVLRNALAVRPRPGRTAAQRCIAPVCCVAAEELAARGFLDESVGYLKTMLLDTAQYDEEIRRELERSYLRISLRFRLFEVDHGTVEALRTSQRPADEELVRLADTLQLSTSTPRLATAYTPQAQHATWRAIVTVDPHSYVERKYLQDWHDVLSKNHGLDAALDSMECALLIDPGASVRARQRIRSEIESDLFVIQGARRPNILSKRDAAALLRAHALSAIELSPADLQQFTTQLGTLRAAEIALDEATILALRLPEKAVWLANQARRWFEASKDRVGTVRALIIGTLVAGPTALRERPEQSLVLDELWRRLFGTPATDGPAKPRVAAGPLWKPWADRYYLISKWRDDRDEAGDSVLLPNLYTPELRAWTSGDSLRATPVTWPPVAVLMRRWASLLAVPAFAAALAFTIIYLVHSSAPHHLQQDFNKGVRDLGTAQATDEGLWTITLLGGFLAVSALAAWAWRQWFVPRWLRIVSKGYSTLVLLLALLGSGIDLVFAGEWLSFVLTVPIWAYAGWRAVRFMRVALGSRRLLPMRLEEIRPDLTSAQPGIGQQSVRLTVSALARIFLPWRMRHGQGKCFQASTTNTLTDGTYQSFAESFDPKLLPLFRRMRRLLGQRRGAFNLKTDTPEQQAWPVEAVAFLNAGVKTRSTRSTPFQFSRSVDAAGVARAARRDADRHEKVAPEDCLVEINALGLFREELHDGVWQSHQKGAGLPGTAPSKARVLHLVGTAYNDSGGLRFHIRRTDPGDTLAATETDAPLMLRAEDITAQAPELTLCVVQGQAKNNTSLRGDSDRRRAGLARVFAARLNGNGVPLVVVIPPLPHRLAGLVASDVSRYATRRRLADMPSFLKMLDELHNRISVTLSVSVDLREQDIVDPGRVARLLLEGNRRTVPLLRELTSAGARQLRDWEKLPREALVGVLLDELIPILRRADLLDLCSRPASLRRLSRWLGIGNMDRARTNRAILSEVFKGGILDGRESARQVAWEVALDVCGFRAESSEADTVDA